MNFSLADSGHILNSFYFWFLNVYTLEVFCREFYLGFYRKFYSGFCREFYSGFCRVFCMDLGKANPHIIIWGSGL